MAKESSRVEGRAAGLASELKAERGRAAKALRESEEARAQLRALAAYLQSVREAERVRIAREIHDELGQLLTGFKMELAWLGKRLRGPVEESLRPRLTDKIQSMSQLVDEMVESVRRISAELRPGMLDDLGLIPAMEWQVREFQQRAGIACQLTSSLKPGKLPQTLCTTVFRIFQETLTNITRHANATRVTVSVQQSASRLLMEIEDNGRGITEEETSNATSLGLAGMRERALALGGTFWIGRATGSGTAVRVSFPLIPS